MTVHAPIAVKARAGTPAAAKVPLQSLTLAVENMHCGGCLRSVERAALGVAGVASARANLSAKRVSVAYDPARTGEPGLIEALARAGFPAAPMQQAMPGADRARQKHLLRCMAVAGFAAMNIMLLSVSVWAGRAEDMDPSQQILFWWISALIALPTVAYAGQPFFASALTALRGWRLNMDVPISLAVLLTTAMSLYQTIRGNDQVYFDAAVSLLFLLLVGRVLDEFCACPRAWTRKEIS
jgi:Cu2+-exporting ATPase